MGVWRTITLSPKNLSVWPEEGDILDIENIPVVYDDKDSEEPCNDLNKNVTNSLFADGDDQGPTPLQNNLILPEIYEVIVDTLNNTSVSETNAQNAINELSSNNGIIRLNNAQQRPLLSSIIIPGMTRNKTTANLQ